MIHELLRAEDLLLDRGGASRIHHMDFSVAAGESVGLIGLSGGGKTSLAQILCGELEADSGRILHGGVPLSRERLAQSGRRISGEDRLLENLSVLENLMVLGHSPRGPAIPRKRLRAACRELLSGFGLEEYLDVPVAQIPVPVQHRLLLAGAAARGKRLVALDHIADTYGPPELERLAACIRRLCAQGVSVLYLSGYLDSVLWQLDRITVVRDGRRIKELPRGSFTEFSLRAYMYGYRSAAEEILEAPEACQTAFFLDGIPMPEAGLIPVHDADGSVDKFLSGLREQSGRTVTVLTAGALFDSWVEELSVLDNLLLPVAQRLGGPGCHVGKAMRRLLRTECMEQTGLSFQQVDQPFRQLSHMERFRLLRYRGILNRTDIYVFDHITSGTDLQDREEMRRISGTLPGLLFYVSGDYRELTAFKRKIYALQNGCLRKELP